MITTCTPDSLPETSDTVVDDRHVARTFLQGERSLAAIQSDAPVLAILDEFLSAAGEAPLQIDRASDALVVRAEEGPACILLTGQTAVVLESYLQGESVSVQERMDMTVRRSRQT